MSDQIEFVDLLSSFIEYRADFQEPMLEVSNFGELNAAIFRAFRPWNIGLTDVTWNPNPTNASEIQSKFVLFKGRYVFTVDLSAIGLSVVNPFWEEAEQIGQIIRAGNTAVSSVRKAEIARQTMNMSLHIRPRQKKLSELTSTFLNPAISSAIGEPIRAHGFSLYADNRIWVVDLSASEHNALFLRLVRTFDSLTPVEQIAEILADDQNKFLRLLGLKIAENGE